MTLLNPLFYIVKLWFTGVYIIFLISAINIDCGYSRLAEAVLTSTHNLCFEQWYSAVVAFVWANKVSPCYVCVQLYAFVTYLLRIRMCDICALTELSHQKLFAILFFFLFLTEAPICNNGSVYIQTWNSPLKDLMEESVNILHYENTPIQIYIKFHLQKLKFSDKKLWYFSYFCSKHRLWGVSNEYPQSMFMNRNKKNNVYLCKSQFYYIRVGIKGVNIISACVRDVAYFLLPPLRRHAYSNTLKILLPKKMKIFR